MILCVIPARGGSKGVPRKNIRLVAGQPLISWTIEAAKACPQLDRIIVSTDDEEIARVAREHGAEVPFLRPSELAQDHTSGIAPVHHAASWLAEQQNYHPDRILMLQSTSPFRPPSLIDDAINLMRDKNCDYVLALAPVKKHPYWMKTITNGWVRPFLDIAEVHTRRQDLPPAYAISGSLYAWTHNALARRREGVCSGATQFPDEKVGAVMIDGIYAVDIDTELDIKLAEFLAADYRAKSK